MHFDEELDTTGLLCPIPILKTRFAIDKLVAGQVLKVISTDRGSIRDMEAFARQTENDLLDSVDGGDHFVFFLRKAGNGA